MPWEINIVISIISHSLPRPVPFSIGENYKRSSEVILEAGYHINYGFKLKVQNFMTCLSLHVTESP